MGKWSAGGSYTYVLNLIILRKIQTAMFRILPLSQVLTLGIQNRSPYHWGGSVCRGIYVCIDMYIHAFMHVYFLTFLSSVSDKPQDNIDSTHEMVTKLEFCFIYLILILLRQWSIVMRILFWHLVMKWILKQMQWWGVWCEYICMVIAWP